MANLQTNISKEDCGLPFFLNRAKRWWTDPALTVSGSTFGLAAMISAGYVDSNAELVSPLPAGATKYTMSLYVAPIGIQGGYLPDYSGVEMTVSWTGNSVTAVSGLNLMSVTPDIGNNKATFYYNSTTGGIFNLTGTPTTNIQFTLDPEAGDAPTNIDVRPTSLIGDTNLIDPATIAFYSKYKRLRFLSPMLDQLDVTALTDFPSTSYAFWGKDDNTAGILTGQKYGWPIDVLIEFANRTGAQICVPIPHLMSDAGITALAAALRDGITWDANEVRVIFSYTNEAPWNFLTSYCATQAASEALTDNGAEWYGYRAGQVLELVRTAFGTDSGIKWLGAIDGQSRNSAVAASALVGVQAHIDNDGGDAASIDELFSELHIAPYFGPQGSTIYSISESIGQTIWGWYQSGGQANVNQRLYDVLKLGAGSDSDYRSLDLIRSDWLAHKTIADAANLTVACYEGGSHLLAANPLRDGNSGEPGDAFNGILAAFANSKEMGDLEYAYLTQFAADTGGTPSEFQMLGTHDKYGAWGARPVFSRMTYRSNACDSFNKGYSYVAGRQAVLVSL